MFRSDRDALAGKVEDLRTENERLRAQNDAMRADLLNRRTAEPPRVMSEIYRSDVSHLSAGERAALSVHGLSAFPIWVLVPLHVITLGFFSLVHFNLMHDRLPRAQHNDPTAARGLGFSFIPYFQLYWLAFNTLRLTDRVNLQHRLRGLPDAVPRWLSVVVAVLSVVPYLNFVGAPVGWLVLAIVMQRGVNQLAEMRDGAQPEVTTERADAFTEAGAAGMVGVPGVRVPAVRDLPGPDEAAAQAAAEEEAAALVTEQRQARR